MNTERLRECNWDCREWVAMHKLSEPRLVTRAVYQRPGQIKAEAFRYHRYVMDRRAGDRHGMRGYGGAAGGNYPVRPGGRLAHHATLLASLEPSRWSLPGAGPTRAVICISYASPRPLHNLGSTA